MNKLNFAILKIVSYLWSTLRCMLEILRNDRDARELISGSSKSKVHGETHKLVDDNFNKSKMSARRRAPRYVYVCTISPAYHWIGNRSDEALFAKCCVHRISLVFSLVSQGEFLSIRAGLLAGLSSQQDWACGWITEERLRKPHGPNTGLCQPW